MRKSYILYLSIYYYAGQKQIINGNQEKGQEILQKFLENQVGSSLDRDLAISELNKLYQNK